MDRLPQEQRMALAYHLGYIDGKEWNYERIARRMNDILGCCISVEDAEILVAKAFENLSERG